MAAVRPGMRDDAPAAVDVFLESLDELYRRMSLPRPPFGRDAVLPVYRHILATGAMQVGEVDGRVVSVAIGIIRGDVWFLSGFWTLPEFQRRGIGDRVLTAVEEAAREGGARTLSTWSSLDPGAMGVYLRHRMLPGFPMLTLAGTTTGRPAPRPDIETIPLSPERAAAIDAEIGLPSRRVDHDMWLEPAGGHRGWEVLRAGRSVGYVHVDGERIGPAAWLAPADASAVLSVGAAEAVAGGGSIRVSIPGVNHAALELGLDLGLRLASYGTFLTSAAFGRLDQYVASGPLLF